MKVPTCLGSELLSCAFAVKQDERIEVFSISVVFQGGVDALSAAFLPDIIQGLVIGFCLFAAAFYNLLKVVL